MKNKKLKIKASSFKFLVFIFAFSLLAFSFVGLVRAASTSTTATTTITKAPPSFWPIVPCGLNAQPSGVDKSVWDYTQECNQCLLIVLFKNLIDLVVKGLVPILGTLFFIWGGFLILVGADKPGRIGDGKKIMWNTAIGIVIILCSFLITNFILGTLATKEFLADAQWSPTGITISCKVSTLKEIVDNTSGFPINVSNPPPSKYKCVSNQCTASTDTDANYTESTCGGNCQAAPPTKYKCVSNQCTASTDADANYTESTCGGTCQPIQVTGGGTCTGVACTFNGRPDVLSPGPVNPGDGCNMSAVNALDSAIRQGAGNISVASGVDTIKLLKAIISNESGGQINIGSGDGKSAGPFQLTPGTAQGYASQCGVNATIDMAWLKNSANIPAEACIAAKYIQSYTGACGSDVRQLAAGYNGGGGGACGVSSDCGPSAGAGQCTVYPNQTVPTRRWECLWEDTAHQVCNSTRPGGTLAYTRSYAPKVEFCYSKF